MEGFLDAIEKYKFAILGTVGIHVIFLVIVAFLTLDHPYVNEDPEATIILPLENIELDPKIMEMMNLNQKPNESENITNVSADANDQREKSYENFSEQELDRQVEEDARNLEKEYEDYWKGTHPDDNSSSTVDLENDRDKPKDPNGNKGQNDFDGGNAVQGSVMVSFNLPDRKKHKLPRPGYTCNSSGTVVVDIKVDKSGTVKSATFNPSLSSGADQCMINKAVKYAKQSSFNYSGNAPGTQSGTITYKFVSK